VIAHGIRVGARFLGHGLNRERLRSAAGQDARAAATRRSAVAEVLSGSRVRLCSSLVADTPPDPATAAASLDRAATALDAATRLRG